MRKLLRRIALAAPIAAAGLIVGLTLPSSGSAGTLVSRPRPERELVEAQRLAGFRLRLPAWLPSGAVLERVSWADEVPGVARTDAAVDVWYRVGGTRLHVWQTNGSSLEKNPLGRGEPITIDSLKWWRERAGLGTALTAQLPDGITVQLSGRFSDAALARIAGSFGS